MARENWKIYEGCLCREVQVVERDHNGDNVSVLKNYAYHYLEQYEASCSWNMFLNGLQAR